MSAYWLPPQSQGHLPAPITRTSRSTIPRCYGNPPSPGPSKRTATENWGIIASDSPVETGPGASWRHVPDSRFFPSGSPIQACTRRSFPAPFRERHPGTAPRRQNSNDGNAELPLPGLAGGLARPQENTSQCRRRRAPAPGLTR